MINGVRIKVCGLTSLVDAEAADAGGADFLGFNLYEKSPRFVTCDQFKAMLPRLPPRKKVVVGVMPDEAELRSWVEVGFDAFQIHFPYETADDVLQSWSRIVGAERLWLAPQMPPGSPLQTKWLGLAQTILWDAHAADKFGGTGRTADWDAFRAARDEHRDTTWVLAGGLSSENVTDALAATGARFLDVNSGVEAAPGVKDPEKLRLFFAAVRQARSDGH